MQKVKNYIIREDLINPGDKIVAGVSGGADSVALLYVLSELSEEFSLTLRVISVNHGLRKEAYEEVDYVRNLCGKLNVPFVLKEADVSALAEKWGVGTEEAGRRVRYEAFEEEAAKLGEDTKIAVAHNSNDVCETMLFNLFRGTGPKGLMSIPPRRGNIIRPLLCVERKEIEKFLNDNKIRFYVDATNLEDDYTRNKIRHNIVEYATKNINDNAVSHIAETVESLREMNEYTQAEVDRLFTLRAKVAEGEIILDVTGLTDTNPYILKALFKKCIDTLVPTNRDITLKHLKSIQCIMDSQESKSLDLPYKIKVNKENCGLRFVTGEQDFSFAEVELSYPEGEIETDEKMRIKWKIMPKPVDFEISKNQYTKFFDYDKIVERPMLRTAREGDYLTIDDKLNKKKLSDYFIDEKITLSRRKKELLVADQSHIWWVLGHRISEYPKVTKDTKNILLVEVIKES